MAERGDVGDRVEVVRAFAARVLRSKMTRALAPEAAPSAAKAAQRRNKITPGSVGQGFSPGSLATRHNLRKPRHRAHQFSILSALGTPQR